MFVVPEDGVTDGGPRPPVGLRRSLASRWRSAVWGLASRLALHGLYAWELERRWLRLERLEVFLPALGEDFDGATLVQLSDLHSSPIMREEHLRNYIDITNALAPDFVVITGDFVTTASRYHARQAAGLLRRLSPRVATLACLGNHDYGLWVPRPRGGSPQMAGYIAQQLASAGIEALVNETRVFRRGRDALRFVGIGDLWSSDYRPEDAFEGLSGDEAAVTLCHNPDAATHLASLGARFILAGHTHGKYVADTRMNNVLFPTQHRRFVGGRYRLSSGACLYVNRGLGHARRVRPEHRPEITHFILRSPVAPAPASAASDAAGRRGGGEVVPATRA
jgi:hypothetical protein